MLDDRIAQVARAGDGRTVLGDRKSSAGSVSQRACTFCGARVVLYPITDALHLVHGAIGCASYTWDIRGARSSDRELHRLSFSTDLREGEVIHGGEKRLGACLDGLIERHKPAAAFVYATCIVGLIGDDVEAVCRMATKHYGIPVIPVQSEGFKGTKKDGYAAACAALKTLITWDGAVKPARDPAARPCVNIVGDFNVAGESWLIRSYLERMGVDVVAMLTGDGRVADVRRALSADLNLVQCAGSMTPLAKWMRDDHGIPFEQVSFFGIEDCSAALYAVAKQFPNHPEVMQRTRELVRSEIARIRPSLEHLRKDLEGMRAALYVGGAFKAFSLVRALRSLGVRTVMAGTQTGGTDDYRTLRDLLDDDAIIADDSNPLELASFLATQEVDLFIGGVKERPIAYKLGVGFVDHNHERKIGLAGFEGMVAFAKEVHATATSPVWSLMPRRRHAVVAKAEPAAESCAGACSSCHTGCTS